MELFQMMWDLGIAPVTSKPMSENIDLDLPF